MISAQPTHLHTTFPNQGINRRHNVNVRLTSRLIIPDEHLRKYLSMLGLFHYLRALNECGYGIGNRAPYGRIRKELREGDICIMMFAPIWSFGGLPPRHLISLGLERL
jgi:hypothetical protein